MARLIGGILMRVGIVVALTSGLYGLITAVVQLIELYILRQGDLMGDVIRVAAFGGFPSSVRTIVVFCRSEFDTR